MVMPEPEINSQGDEVQSPLQSNNQQANDNNHHPFSSLGRQSSIYSLTLDEFQHALCESGKNFGSMNMDEFLTSIWMAEESQAINSNNNNNHDRINNLSLNENTAEKGTIRKQPSLPRQGSLTIPAPLCRKTVDEVWSEIHNNKGLQHQNNNNNNDNNNNSNDRGATNVQHTKSARRQPTFGEMTLEDFLVKAGVVREQGAMTVHASHHQQQYGIYQNNNNSAMGPSFVGGPVFGGTAGGGGSSGGNVVAPPYPVVARGCGVGAIGESSGYAGNGKRDAGYPQPQLPPAVCYGGRMVNGGGGYAAPMIGMAAPVSPVSSDGIGTNENSAGQFGMDMGGLRGRKRMLDGPVEKVVERRQKRMIKNRESAARSRARKQAYTVELEAELNQLREENNQLKQALAELERRRKQQCLEEMNERVQTKAQKANKRLRSLRRNLSCPL
ncbi:hypothetical protein RIF29_20655 [Crotalaria pallida]|uniref:BZIP domain-containing protein n=1 Tax=Crotalaria pallida TaxID=3830 RepID=A0AAN9F1M5_CROPI